MTANQYFSEDNNLTGTMPDELLAALEQRLKSSLPGVRSQIKLAPLHRIRELQQDAPASAIQSSVLLLLYPHEGKLMTVVMLRPEYDGPHSGQISLPGGRREDFDETEADTAIRETHEELGVAPEQIKIIGSLTPLYINKSNYIIFPFIGYSRNKPIFNPDNLEVKEIIELKLSELLKPETIKEKILTFKNGFTLNAPGFVVKDHFIWGATAMIFSEFIDIMKSINLVNI